VKTVQVAFTIAVQVFFALRSLLRTDQWLCTPTARVWLGVAAGAPCALGYDAVAGVGSVGTVAVASVDGSYSR